MEYGRMVNTSIRGTTDGKNVHLHLEVRVFPRLGQEAIVEEGHAVGVVPRLPLALVLHDGVEGHVLHHLHLCGLERKKKKRDRGTGTVGKARSSQFC